jgi:hypothetical protein
MHSIDILLLARGRGSYTSLKAALLLDAVLFLTRNGTAMTPAQRERQGVLSAGLVRRSRLGARLAVPCAQGRNSYPDFWVGDDDQTTPIEGYEIKSLAFAKGKPARRDYDSNSTIPAGRKDGRDVFLVFFLYTGSGAIHVPCIRSASRMRI